MIILRRVAACLAGLFLCLGQSTLAQQASPQSVVRDPQAIAILTQVIASAGGVGGVAAVQDLTASGTVTFSWAGENVVANATAKGRGPHQFRLEATLPDGNRTWGTSNGQGFKRDSDGTVTITPYHPLVSMENILFPLAQLVAAAQTHSARVSYVGLETWNGFQVHHIRICEAYAQNANPAGTVEKSATADFYVDAGTMQIRSVLTVAFLKDYLSGTVPREIQYSDYRQVNGIVVPFSITELIGGQQTLTIQLSQVSFNSNLTDSDFQP